MHTDKLFAFGTNFTNWVAPYFVRAAGPPTAEWRIPFDLLVDEHIRSALPCCGFTNEVDRLPPHLL